MIVATEVVAEAHVTWLVRFCVVLSLIGSRRRELLRQALGDRSGSPASPRSTASVAAVTVSIVDAADRSRRRRDRRGPVATPRRQPARW